MYFLLYIYFMKFPSGRAELRWKESIIRWGILSRSFSCYLWNWCFLTSYIELFWQSCLLLQKGLMSHKKSRRLFLVLPKWEGVSIGGKYIIVWRWGTKERVKEMITINSESLESFNFLQLKTISFLICAVELKRRKDLLYSCTTCTHPKHTQSYIVSLFL